MTVSLYVKAGIRGGDQQQVWHSAPTSQLLVRGYLLVLVPIASSPWGTPVRITWWVQCIWAARDLFGSWGRSTARCIRSCGGNTQSEKTEVQKFPSTQESSETFWGIYSAKNSPDSRGILPEKVVWMPKVVLIPKCRSLFQR